MVSQRIFLRAGKKKKQPIPSVLREIAMFEVAESGQVWLALVDGWSWRPAPLCYDERVCAILWRKAIRRCCVGCRHADTGTRVEYARPILERHESAASEADIRSAVRDYLIQTGLAPESEMQQEAPPAPGESGRVDLRTRDVIFEFKRSIGDGLNPHADYVTQLDDYLVSAVAGGQPQRFGILTDGKYWVLRWPGMGAVSWLATHKPPTQKAISRIRISRQ
ncbi:MAG: hypothetical protein OXG27_05005 [Chloroflexi bacterium]|nr:hypothetical protein [Chloroflexota bacterium]